MKMQKYQSENKEVKDPIKKCRSEGQAHLPALTYKGSIDEG
jgi:hypothetical protein